MVLLNFEKFVCGADIDTYLKFLYVIWYNMTLL